MWKVIPCLIGNYKFKYYFMAKGATWFMQEKKFLNGLEVGKDSNVFKFFQLFL